jgi:hypothetical protein
MELTALQFENSMECFWILCQSVLDKKYELESSPMVSIFEQFEPMEMDNYLKKFFGKEIKHLIGIKSQNQDAFID